MLNPERTILNPSPVSNSLESYSRSIKVSTSKLLFVAWQVPVTLNGTPVSVEDVAAQTIQGIPKSGERTWQRRCIFQVCSGVHHILGRAELVAKFCGNPHQDVSYHIPLHGLPAQHTIDYHSAGQ